MSDAREQRLAEQGKTTVYLLVDDVVTRAFALADLAFNDALKLKT